MSAARTRAKHVLWRSGAYAVATRLRPWRGVAVLAYHGVRAATTTRLGTIEELHVRQHRLDEQLQVVRALATPVSIADWREARRSGHPLPDRAVLVTFDDGYRSVLHLALPLLEHYGVPAAVFVCTGSARSGRLLWYDAYERQQRSRQIEPAKALPYAQWRHVTNSCVVAATPGDERAIMTPDEIATLAVHPLIEVGGHTVDHPILARAPLAVQRQQIADSLSDLREWTSRDVRAFAYPNGRPNIDFTAETVAIVRELGIDVAFSTEPRIAAATDAWDACPRFTMLDTMTAGDLAHCLSISWPEASA